MTKSIFYSARLKTSKLAAFLLVCGTSLFWSPSANAVYTGVVQVTCANGTFSTGWDNSNQYFATHGNIAAHYCDIVQHSDYVSDNLTDDSFRWYNGVKPTPSPSETQTPVSSNPVVPSDTPTASASPSPSPSETITVVASPQPSPSETTTVQIQETSTVTIAPSPAPSETLTAIVETSTVISQEPLAPVAPIPSVPATPPAVEPAPQPAVVIVLAPQPQPEPAPEPVVVPEPAPEPAPEPVPELPAPIVEEPPVPAEPVQEPALLPVEEPPAEAETPVELPPQETVVTPEPAVVPAIVETPSNPPIVEPVEYTKGMDLSSLSPDAPVQLENGVVLTAEVVVALQLFDDPTQLVSELFTDPGQVLTALSNIGADLSPEVRAKAKKTIVAAVIVGQIAAQAAVNAAGVAAYRRKP